MDRLESSRAYYRTLDAGAYGALRDLLAPGFVHERPDRILEGRDRFVRFMRDERPLTDTTHELVATFSNDAEVAARGRLLDGDGALVVAFVDVFTFADDGIARIRTYTN